jgi:hypothetical protein
MLNHQDQNLYGELATSPASPRKAAREGCEIGAGLRQRGASGVSVQILDLSTHGFRASTHLDLPQGADVWLKLPGLEALHARVAWMNGYLVGCEFMRPLHPAVLQMVVRK